MKEQTYLMASQVAEMIGGKWSRKTVHEYLKRGKFPEPVMKIGISPVWTPEQVEQYKRERGIGQWKDSSTS